MSSPAQPRLRRLLQDLLAPQILPALVLGGCLGVTAVLWQGASSDAEQQEGDGKFLVQHARAPK